MDRFSLSNGYEIPVIGYGTYPQKESLPENIVNAFNAGYRLFDTSDNYLNENYAGEGIKKVENEDCCIITKYSRPGHETRFSEAFNDSKNLLGRVDVYLLHWPYPFLWKLQWRKMEKLYQQGKVKAIGVCNFEVDKLRKLLKFCKVSPMINQIERHPLFQQTDIVSFCKTNNIQVMCYSPVARADEELMNNPDLIRIADKYHKTVSQVILRWDIDTGTIPIPGAASFKHICQNIDVFDFRLSTEDINVINNLDAGKRIRFDPKKRFTKKQCKDFFVFRLKYIIKSIIKW